MTMTNKTKCPAHATIVVVQSVGTLLTGERYIATFARCSYCRGPAHDVLSVQCSASMNEGHFTIEEFDLVNRTTHPLLILAGGVQFLLEPKPQQTGDTQ